MPENIPGKNIIHQLLIRRRSDYIIGFIAPAIGPNKSKKLTQLIAPVHNIRGKVWMKTTYMASQTAIGCEAMYVVFHSNFAAYIVCRRFKPCEFLWFVWTDCWGNKSYYVITSPANSYCSSLQTTCSTVQDGYFDSSRILIISKILALFILLAYAFFIQGSGITGAVPPPPTFSYQESFANWEKRGKGKWGRKEGK